ncbi:MAG TPA: TetR/AcrR family transcriptional regulator [Roseiflexaceae bacterium]|nr:TetR/AcrR family transcriptional regulator [Roseiflexaceae bacterium]
MTGSLRERRRQQLREEILDAAQGLVAEKGYGAMNMDELAARVGISKPTLYSHFANKGELVVAAATRDIRQLIALMEEQAAGRSPLDRLTFVMREVLQRHIQVQTMGIGPWPEIYRLLCENEEALGAMRRIHEDVVAQVEAAIAEGQIDPRLDPAAVVLAFYGLMSALAKPHLGAIALAEPERTAEALVEIFVRGVRKGEG